MIQSNFFNFKNRIINKPSMELINYIIKELALLDKRFKNFKEKESISNIVIAYYSVKNNNIEKTWSTYSKIKFNKEIEHIFTSVPQKFFRPSIQEIKEKTNDLINVIENFPKTDTNISIMNDIITETFNRAYCIKDYPDHNDLAMAIHELGDYNIKTLFLEFNQVNKLVA